MAISPFTVRSTSASAGSYLRYDRGGTADDTRLRSGTVVDPIPEPPPVFEDTTLQFAESFLRSTTVCYGEIDLDWAVNLTAIEDVGADAVATGVVLVYSPNGEPQSIATGEILLEGSFPFNYVHTGLPEGRWAYYSLFLHYEDNAGTSYFQRSASVKELVPKNYASVMHLWNRVPPFYREQDIALARQGWLDRDGNLHAGTDFSPCIGSVPLEGVVGPLFKFLAIFGFEMDRTRTLLDYVMTSYDPEISDSEALDMLSWQMAVGMGVDDLGASRLRTLMNDIGYFHRTKGTPTGISFWAKAITGGDLIIDQSAYTISLLSQRANYVPTPKTGGSFVTYRSADSDEDVLATADAFSDTSFSGSHPYTASGTSYGASPGIDNVMFHLTCPVPVRLGDSVAFSVHSNVGTAAMKWMRLVTNTGLVVGSTETQVLANGQPALQATVIETTNVSLSTTKYLNVYIEFLVAVNEVPVFVLEKLLAELNHLGNYFDGDTIRGGWLVETGSSVSDYRWSGATDNSISIYADEYERTKGIVNALLFDAFPINEAAKYTISAYNAVPGTGKQRAARWGSARWGQEVWA